MTQFEDQKQKIIDWISNLKQGDKIDPIYQMISDITPQAKQLKWYGNDKEYSKDISYATFYQIMNYGLYINHGSYGKEIYRGNSFEECRKAAQEHYNKSVLEQIA